jgi:hypothetical protein
MVDDTALAHHAAIEKGQPGSHQQHQARGRQHPGEVGRVEGTGLGFGVVLGNEGGQQRYQEEYSEAGNSEALFSSQHPVIYKAIESETIGNSQIQPSNRMAI